MALSSLARCFGLRQRVRWSRRLRQGQGQRQSRHAKLTGMQPAAAAAAPAAGSAADGQAGGAAAGGGLPLVAPEDAAAAARVKEGFQQGALRLRSTWVGQAGWAQAARRQRGRLAPVAGLACPKLSTSNLTPTWSTEEQARPAAVTSMLAWSSKPLSSSRTALSPEKVAS